MLIKREDLNNIKNIWSSINERVNQHWGSAEKKSIAYEKSVYLFHCPRLNRERQALPSTMKNIDDNLLDMTKPILTTTIIFGSSSFDINTNTIVLNSTMNLVYLLKDLTSRFFIELADCCRNEVLNLFD